jgi:hypothetical protein
LVWLFAGSYYYLLHSFNDTVSTKNIAVGINRIFNKMLMRGMNTTTCFVGGHSLGYLQSLILWTKLLSGGAVLQEWTADCSKKSISRATNVYVSCKTRLWRC